MNIAEFEKVLDEVAPMAGVAGDESCWPSHVTFVDLIQEMRRAFNRLYEASVALVTAEAFSTYDEQFDRLYRKSLEALEGK